MALSDPPPVAEALLTPISNIATPMQQPIQAKEVRMMMDEKLSEDKSPPPAAEPSTLVDERGVSSPRGGSSPRGVSVDKEPERVATDEEEKVAANNAAAAAAAAAEDAEEKAATTTTKKKKKSSFSLKKKMSFSLRDKVKKVMKAKSFSDATAAKAAARKADEQKEAEQKEQDKEQEPAGSPPNIVSMTELHDFMVALKLGFLLVGCASSKMSSLDDLRAASDEELLAMEGFKKAHVLKVRRALSDATSPWAAAASRFEPASPQPAAGAADAAANGEEAAAEDEGVEKEHEAAFAAPAPPLCLAGLPAWLSWVPCV